MKDPEQIAKFTEVEKKIEDQVERLDKLLLAKSSAPRGCSDLGLGLGLGLGSRL